jgi:hypothetical protein
MENMKNRVLVVPDVHGRTFWKEGVSKWLEDVDKVVFLGDYLDPYEYHLPDALYANLMEIIELKRKEPEKVVLLKGNHDEHYASRLFRELGGGSRMDVANWDRYHEVFSANRALFRLAHLEVVGGVPYVFTHAGLTAYWLSKVNETLWHIDDDELSVADPAIIDRINALAWDNWGPELLAVVGHCRSWFGGEKTGSILWADIREHSLDKAPHVYGLDEVFQVFGHTRLDGEEEDMIRGDHLAMIDSQKCFLIDDGISVLQAKLAKR